MDSSIASNIINFDILVHCLAIGRIGFEFVPTQTKFKRVLANMPVNRVLRGSLGDLSVQKFHRFGLTMAIGYCTCSFLLFLIKQGLS
ncbi:MAG: hypothetical protein ACPGJV_13675 [Bacteriovoracaceae bacterium]